MKSELESQLSQGRQYVQLAYDQVKKGVELEDNLTPEVEKNLDGVFQTVESELEEFEDDIANLYEELDKEPESPEDLNKSVQYAESAGQALANAAAGMTVIINRAEGCAHNGEDSLGSGVSSIPLTGGMPDGVEQIHSAREPSSEGFEAYDNALQQGIEEIAEINRNEFGVVGHYDMGLGQQEPNIKF